MMGQELVFNNHFPPSMCNRSSSATYSWPCSLITAVQIQGVHRNSILSIQGVYEQPFPLSQCKRSSRNLSSHLHQSTDCALKFHQIQGVQSRYIQGVFLALMPALYPKLPSQTLETMAVKCEQNAIGRSISPLLFQNLSSIFPIFHSNLIPNQTSKYPTWEYLSWTAFYANVQIIFSFVLSITVAAGWAVVLLKVPSEGS